MKKDIYHFLGIMGLLTVIITVGVLFIVSAAVIISFNAHSVMLVLTGIVILLFCYGIFYIIRERKNLF